MRLTGTRNGRDWLITNKIRRYGRIPLDGFLARVGGEPEVKKFDTILQAKAYVNKVLAKPMHRLSEREKMTLTWRR